MAGLPEKPEDYLSDTSTPTEPTSPGLFDSIRAQPKKGLFDSIRTSKNTSPLQEPIVGTKLRRAAEYYKSTMGSFSPTELREQFEKMRVTQPQQRALAAAQADSAIHTIDSFYDGAGQIAGLLRERAKRSGKPLDRDNEDWVAYNDLNFAMEEHRNRKITPGDIFRGAGRTTRATMEVLDKPFKFVRSFSPKEDGSTPTSEEWNQMIKDSKNPLVQVGRTVTDIASLPIGLATGSVAAGAVATAEAIRTMRGEKDAAGNKHEFDLQAVGEAGRQSLEDSGDFVRSLVADPLNWATLGGGAEAKGSFSAITRFLRASKQLDAIPPEALARVKDILKTADAGEMIGDQTRRAMIPKAMLDVEEELAKHGVELPQEVFGKKGEFFGKTGPGVVVPFTEKGVQLSDIASRLGAHKTAAALAHPLADIAASVNSSLAAKGANTPLFDSADASSRAAQVKISKGMAEKKALQAQFNREEVELAKKAREAGLDNEDTWRDFSRKTADPDFKAQTRSQLVAEANADADTYLSGLQQAGSENEASLREQYRKEVVTGAKLRFEDEAQWVHANGQAEKRVITPASDYEPASGSGRAFLDAHQDLMADRLKRMRDAGIEVGQAQNPVSKAYIPRQTELVDDLLRDTGPLTERRGTGAGNPFMSRTGDANLGVALGDERMVDEAKLWGNAPGALKAETNLLHGTVKYDSKVASAVSRAKLEREMRLSGIDIDRPDIQRSIADMMSPERHDISQLLRKSGHPVSRAVADLLDAGDKLLSQWKLNGLIFRPGYHVVNFVNDLAYMNGLGVANPITSALKARAGMLKPTTTIKVAGQTKTWAEIVDMMHQHNIAVGAMDRAGLTGVGNLRTGRQLDRISRGKSPVGLDPGGRIAEASENLGMWTRAGAFVDLLDKGYGAQQAAELVRTGMVNYEGGGSVLSALSKLFPFARFMTRAPAATTQMLVRRPGAINTTRHFAESIEGEAKPGVEPRDYIQERSPAYRIPGWAENPVSLTREMLGGDPIGPDEQQYALSRDGFIEPLLQWTEPLSGNLAAGANNTWPHIRMLTESIAKEDLLTRRPMTVSAAPLNPNTPWWASAAVGGIGGAMLGGGRGALLGAGIGAGLGAGEWAEATAPNSQGWLSRYFSGAFAPGIATLPLNVAVRGEQGETQGQANTIGALRAFDSRNVNPGNALAAQAISLMTGFPQYTESPMGGLWNTTHSGGLEDLSGQQEEIRKLMLSIQQAMVRERLRR